MTDVSVGQVKVSIIYYSATGTIYRLAQAIAEGAEKAGAEVTIRKVRELAPEEAIATNEGWVQHRLETQDVPEATADDVVNADAVIFGSPTRYGNIAAQLKQFLDTLGPQWSQNLLADKVYSGFTSTSTEHGGQESTILALYNTIHHFGGLVVAPGYTDPVKFADGNPYGTSFVAGQGNPPDDVALNAARYQGERVVRIAAALKAGLAFA
ncbi:MAG TPA: NAD(P)H:quinone oxidoreductase [Kineosporiaceae bacterium]|nr:NAD(P)H:quinone oxidoreductase [Kineosporiaceae bacterium]